MHLVFLPLERVKHFVDNAIHSCLLVFLGELRDFYRLTPIAVIGDSFFPHLTGHNISEAAAAGCAVLTGQCLVKVLLIFLMYGLENFSGFTCRSSCWTLH